MITEINQLTGLCFYLVTTGYLSETQVFTAFQEAKIKNISFITYLGQENYLTYRQLAEAISSYFQWPFFDLNSYDLSLYPRDVLKIETILKSSIFPLQIKGHELHLATADPSTIDINEINFLTGLTTIPFIVEMDKLQHAISVATTYQEQVAEDHSTLAAEINASFTEPELEHTDEEDKVSVVGFLNQILLTAVDKQASDIHFEPYADYYRIRFRLDGILYEFCQQPLTVAKFLTARLKVMARLDIAERRIPQDGRFKLELSKHRTVDFRLNTCPTQYGEKVVLRLLGYNPQLLEINHLGMEPEQEKIFLNAISNPQGLILVTGPTGSGKTVTLYSALNQLNTSEVNILSVEDPIEIQLSGINQAQINTKTGFSFATALRSFLRQDPDIIMLGEIRDLETAEICIKAAQTGHLVLSTLHTNRAPEAIVRLSNLGVAPFNIASSVILIIAQRLIRRVCPTCKQRIHVPANRLRQEGFQQSELTDLVIYKAQGCTACHQGYKGRVGIYELLSISKEMARLITKTSNPLALIEQAEKDKLVNLRRAALEKVKQGISTIEEINRVIRRGHEN